MLLAIPSGECSTGCLSISHLRMLGGFLVFSILGKVSMSVFVEIGFHSSCVKHLRLELLCHMLNVYLTVKEAAKPKWSYILHSYQQSVTILTELYPVILLIDFFKFYFILLYNTVLVLPYINMNPPRVYTCSQS